MPSATIRLTIPADTRELVRITDETGFFKPHEIETLQEVFDDYHAENHEAGHLCFTCVADDGKLDGFVYVAPAPMTLGSWHLWWIVVRRDSQSRGIGGELLRFAEKQIREQEGRVVFIETSSQPLYEPTRRFYLKHGYDRHAVLEDFYAEGDSMIVYRRSIRHDAC